MTLVTDKGNPVNRIMLVSWTLLYLRYNGIVYNTYF